jgi:hypothetical protein
MSEMATITVACAWRFIQKKNRSTCHLAWKLAWKRAVILSAFRAMVMTMKRGM